MSDFSIEDIEIALSDAGELMVVLESGRVYELHTHNTEFAEKYGQDMIVIEGHFEDGHVEDIYFPPSSVEHFVRHY